MKCASTAKRPNAVYPLGWSETLQRPTHLQCRAHRRMPRQCLYNALLAMPHCDLERGASSAAAHATVLGLVGLQPLDGLLLRTWCWLGRGGRLGIASWFGLLRNSLARGGPAHLLNLHGELDCIGGSLCSQVVEAGLKTKLPAVEVHGRQLRGCRIHHVDVQRLRLVDVSATVGCHVQDNPLLDLPDGLVKLLKVGGEVQQLDAAVVSNELHTHVIGPEAPLDEVSEQVPVDLNELA
mmetsp:Transcript_9849/g.29471  ORF Transcript_9849/g.29471 Transcript_9849/m.29471 type:complete len:237 (+) Transcript_9849:2-712(+)